MASPPSFQSTSVISDGRIYPADEFNVDSMLFQSTSVISDGRIALPAPDVPLSVIVSIHVRHF